MNCPDCDTLMFKDECRCGFKIPRISTIEIKEVGAQVSNDPVEIKQDVAEMLSKSKLTGRPLAELCVKYSLDLLKKARAKKELELMQRKGLRTKEHGGY